MTGSGSTAAAAAEALSPAAALSAAPLVLPAVHGIECASHRFTAMQCNMRALLLCASNYRCSKP